MSFKTRAGSDCQREVDEVELVDVLLELPKIGCIGLRVKLLSVDPVPVVVGYQDGTRCE